jgi:hypothetical protein
VVLDAEGKPLAEAEVRGTAFYPGGFDSSEVTTDEKGRFRLGGLQEDLGYNLRAGAEGYGPEALEEVKPDGDPVELRLQKAGIIRGRVVTGDPPRPLVGFTVEPHGKSDDATPAALRMAGIGPTPERFRDPDGVFELESLAAGDYTLKIAAAGFIPRIVEEIEVVPGKTEDVGDVFIDRGATLQGTVVTKDGEPLGAAAVTLENPAMFANAFARMAQGGGDAGVITRPDGSFTLAGLAPGRHTIKVNHESHAPGKVEFEIETGIPPEDVTVELGPGGSIEGNIRDKSGQPLVGGLVMAMAGMMPDARSIASTDDVGFYRLENLAPGSYRVMAMPQPTGRRGEQDRVLGGLQMSVAQVMEGEATIVNLPAAENPINVRGVVRKGRSSVESRLFFTQISADGTSAEQFAAATTDGGGNFQVQLSGPGTYQVYVQPKGEQQDMMSPGTRVRVEIPDEPEVTQDLVISEIHLAGLVTDGETGTPLASTRVVAIVVEEDGSDPERDDMVTMGQTDEDGRYSLDGFDPGSYRLVFYKEGFQETPLGPIEVGEDDELDDLDVALLPGHPLTVRVVDDNGVPVEGAFVMPLGFSLAWFGGSGGTTDVDGRLKVGALVEAGDGRAGRRPQCEDQAPPGREPVALGPRRRRESRLRGHGSHPRGRRPGPDAPAARDERLRRRVPVDRTRWAARRGEPRGRPLRGRGAPRRPRRVGHGAHPLRA